MIKKLDCLTIAIPFYGRCRYRLRNLQFTISQLNKAGITPVIVEQLACNTPIQITGSYEHIKFRFVCSDFNKNLLISNSLNILKTEYIWVLDADCTLDFDNILETIDLHKDCIQPQRKVKFLTEYETQQLFNKQKTITELTKTKSYLYSSNFYGATSYIFSKKFAMENNIFDSAYTKWGLEDYDIFMRCDAATIIDVNYKTSGVHLWHPEPQDKQVTYIKNLNYFENHHGLLKDTKKYIKRKYHSNITI